MEMNKLDEIRNKYVGQILPIINANDEVDMSSSLVQEIIKESETYGFEPMFLPYGVAHTMILAPTRLKINLDKTGKITKITLG